MHEEVRKSIYLPDRSESSVVIFLVILYVQDLVLSQTRWLRDTIKNGGKFNLLPDDNKLSRYHALVRKEKGLLILILI